MEASLIRKNNERTYGMGELAGMLPDRRSVSRETVRRWCLIGVEKGLPCRIFMEYEHGTAGIRSSVDAYRRFMSRIQELKQ